MLREVRDEKNRNDVKRTQRTVQSLLRVYGGPQSTNGVAVTAVGSLLFP